MTQQPLFRAFEKSIKEELLKALTDNPPADTDTGIVALALSYAEMIDADPAKLPKLGPHLLAALVELKMTPKARTGATMGRPPRNDDNGGSTGAEPAESELDRLRREREEQRTAGRSG
jgi:hypothetical protein